MKTTIQSRAQRLARNARETMREFSLGYRRNARVGNVAHALKNLLFAAHCREIARGYKEAA